MTVREAQQLGVAIASLRAEEVIQHSVKPNAERGTDMDALRKFSNLLEGLVQATGELDRATMQFNFDRLNQMYARALRKCPQL